jgi:hypothetical protein
MILECARGVAAQANAYDMYRIRKNQRGVGTNAYEDVIRIERVYNVPELWAIPGDYARKN